MRFDTELPKKYSGRVLELPAFDEQGRITRRVRFSLENTLYLHSRVSRIHARNTHNNPRNFLVEGVSIVGSCARLNRADSDIDYLLICPHIDESRIPRSGAADLLLVRGRLPSALISILVPLRGAARLPTRLRRRGGIPILPGCNRNRRRRPCEPLGCARLRRQ